MTVIKGRSSISVKLKLSMGTHKKLNNVLTTKQFPDPMTNLDKNNLEKLIKVGLRKNHKINDDTFRVSCTAAIIILVRGEMIKLPSG